MLSVSGEMERGGGRGDRVKTTVLLRIPCPVNGEGGREVFYG